jgi:hypothetical protein
VFKYACKLGCEGIVSKRLGSTSALWDFSPSLMSQEEVLDFKSVRRLEQVGDQRSNQSQDHAHRVGSCADSAEPRESVRM